MQTRRRIGLIVPSSNTTMETELPALFRRREVELPERFSFHSARVAMESVDAASLTAMNAQAGRAAGLLAHAGVEVQAYACLVAIMSQGPGTHRSTAAALEAVAGVPVLSSAGALVEGLRHLGATRVAMICPYTRPLAETVITYLASEGIEVVDHIALGIADNRAVGALNPDAPARLCTNLDLTHAQAIIASACVQMPSLASVQRIQDRTGLPTLSASVATAWQLLRSLNLRPTISAAGALLHVTQDTP
ncbi:MAG: maleate isomerase [Myxococcota bacterium]